MPEITELSFELTLVFLQNKTYGFERLIVASGSLSKIHYSIFNPICVPVRECWRKIDWRLNEFFNWKVQKYQI